MCARRRIPVDHPTSRAGAAERDVLRQDSVEQHGVVVTVFRDESDHARSCQCARTRASSRPASARSSSRCPLPSTAGDSDDLAGADRRSVASTMRTMPRDVRDGDARRREDTVRSAVLRSRRPGDRRRSSLGHLLADHRTASASRRVTSSRLSAASTVRPRRSTVTSSATPSASPQLVRDEHHGVALRQRKREAIAAAPQLSTGASTAVGSSRTRIARARVERLGDLDALLRPDRERLDARSGIEREAGRRRQLAQPLRDRRASRARP